MFKVNDKVKILKGHYADGVEWNYYNGREGIITKKTEAIGFDWEVNFPGSVFFYFSEQELELIESKTTNITADESQRYGHPMFYELLKQMADLHSRKNHDYAGTKNPLRNLKASERINVDPFIGVMIRLQDKWSRLESFLQSGEFKVKDESVEDTLMDNAVYSLLAIILRREQKNKKPV